MVIGSSTKVLGYFAIQSRMEFRCPDDVISMNASVSFGSSVESGNLYFSGKISEIWVLYYNNY